MIYSITASKDATLYENIQEGIYSSSMNTGIDEILTIEKRVSSSLGPGPYNSRILIQFDIPKSIHSGSSTTSADGNFFINPDGTAFTSPSTSIKLYSADNSTLTGIDPVKIKIEPNSQSWGRGKGRKSTKPIVHEKGCSWKYTNGTITAATWSNHLGIPAPGAPTHSATLLGYSIHQRNYDETHTQLDYDVDITKLITKITASSYPAGTLGVDKIPNNGFIIQQFPFNENINRDPLHLQFFSTNTHTIYQPRLEFKWDDSKWSTGSLAELDTTDASSVFLYLKNNRGNYKYGEKAKFRIQGREKYPTKTYGNTSAELSLKYLPSGSAFYSVKDLKTGESVLPYSDNYTKLSCDSTGNYFEMFTSNLSPERYYQIEVKLKASGSSTDVIGYYPIKDIFKVVR